MSPPIPFLSVFLFLSLYTHSKISFNSDKFNTLTSFLLVFPEFWVSRATYNSPQDAATSTEARTAHIRGVIPPDEYVDHVDDSVYTNFVAAQALRFAVRASEVLGLSTPPVSTTTATAATATATTAASAVTVSTSNSSNSGGGACAQCATWSQLAGDLMILFDETLGVHPEYSGYPGNIVKQADVVLLHYPLGLPMTAAVQRSNLDYYSQRTDPGGPVGGWLGEGSCSFTSILFTFALCEKRFDSIYYAFGCA